MTSRVEPDGPGRRTPSSDGRFHVIPRHFIDPGRLAGASILRAQGDERLVDMTRAGQDRAFEVLVARYRAPLHRFCAGMLSPSRAEDAVQQAFMNAYAAMKADEAKLNFEPWLYRIARNISIDALRQSGWSDEELDPEGGVSEGPEGVVERRQQLARAVVAVQALPDRQRNAVVLRELEGRSYEDIATRLGVTDGAVRQLLHRARSSLRAAATSLTPIDLLYRFGARMPGGPPTSTRIAELTAGAGAVAAVPKVVAAVLVTGAIAGGVAGPPAVFEGPDRATAAESPERGGGESAAARVEEAPRPGTRAASGRGVDRRRRDGDRVSHRRSRAGSTGRRHSRSRGAIREREGRRASGAEDAGDDGIDQSEGSGPDRSDEVESEDAHEAREGSSGPGGEVSSSGREPSNRHDVSGSDDDRDTRDSEGDASQSSGDEDEHADEGPSERD
jgi:RNA polymerase sigma factor (sigma-70 family)